MVLTTRFAPSPTGHLHLGSAFAALFAWRRARESGGRFRLRLEDIDRVRCRPEYADGIVDDLRWLGLDWDGPVRVQSEHFAEYRATLAALAARGLAYPCFCSRGDIEREIAASGHAPHAPDGSVIYPGTCRALPPQARAEHLASGAPHVMRLDVAAGLRTMGGRPITFEEVDDGRVSLDPAAFGDIVIARRDAPGSYHLCVTQDDAIQGVTVVTRGLDLKPATAVQRLLQDLMGWPPPLYQHHRLLLAPDGTRLAKRDRAVSIRHFREAGRSPEEVRAMAGFPETRRASGGHVA